MNRHGLSGIGQKKKNRASGRLSLTLAFFSFKSLLLRTLCGFFLPCIIDRLYLAFVSPLSPPCPCVLFFFFWCFFFFIGWSCFKGIGGRGALRQTQIERRGKGKHRVFLIGEPEGRGMDGRKRGERGNSCPCWGALQH